MKISGNFILVSMIGTVVLLMIFWMVTIQTQKDFPNLTNQIVAQKELEESVERGELIFKNEECYICHKLDKRDCFGPKIKNITERRSKEFLFQFIRDEQSMFESGNKEVIQLKEIYNYANGLHNKKHLSDKEIQDLLNYLDSF